MNNEVVGLHIEPTNICTLKCPACPRTRFLETWPQYWKNHSLDIDVLMKFLDIDLQGRAIYMCGNYGDPIYHPDFVEFVSRFKERGAHVSIVTNGSYKSQQWWQQLTAVLDDRDLVTFSIDGVPSNFTKYRINADWNSIKTGIETCVDNSVPTVWKYIPFSFNETNIEQAHQLSQELGVSRLDVEPSDRFDESTVYLKPSAALIGSRYVPQQSWKQAQAGAVSPHCNNGKEHFITADGFYTPCCWLSDYRFYYKSQFGKQKKNYSIAEHTLTEILTRQDTIEFYNSRQLHPGCQYNCPGKTNENS